MGPINVPYEVTIIQPKMAIKLILYTLFTTNVVHSLPLENDSDNNNNNENDGDGEEELPCIDNFHPPTCDRPCQNGSACGMYMNEHGDYKLTEDGKVEMHCICEPGFSGDFCEVDHSVLGAP